MVNISFFLRPRAYAAIFYACVDTLAIVMFLGSYFWLRHFEQALDKSYRRHQVCKWFILYIIMVYMICYMVY